MERRQRNILRRWDEAALANTRSAIVGMLHWGIMVVRTEYWFALEIASFLDQLRVTLDLE